MLIIKSGAILTYFTRTYLGEVDSLLLSEDNHQEEGSLAEGDSHHQQGGSQSQEGIQGQVGSPLLVQAGNLWQEGIHQWEDIQHLEDNQAENRKQQNVLLLFSHFQYL